MTKSGKHCGKKRNCLFWAISSFVTMFSNSPLLQRRQKASIWGKGLKQLYKLCKYKQMYITYINKFTLHFIFYLEPSFRQTFFVASTGDNFWKIFCQQEKWLMSEGNEMAIMLFYIIWLTRLIDLIVGCFTPLSKKMYQLYCSVSWISYQYYWSIYPDTNQSVIMLAPQPWAPRKTAITTISKVFVMIRQG